MRLLENVLFPLIPTFSFSAIPFRVAVMTEAVLPPLSIGRETFPHLLKEGMGIKLLPPSVPLGIQDGEICCGFIESRSPVFIAGRKLGVGWGVEMIMCTQGWPEALGQGVGGKLTGNEENTYGNFFTSFGPPAVTGFDKRRNNKNK